MTIKQFIRRNKEGAIIGGILGAISGFVPSATTICVRGLNFNNAICSIQATAQEFGTFAAIRSTPFLLVKNIFSLEGFGEIAVLPILIILGIIIGAFIDSIWRPLK